MCCYNNNICNPKNSSFCSQKLEDKWLIKQAKVDNLSIIWPNEIGADNLRNFSWLSEFGAERRHFVVRKCDMKYIWVG